MQITYMNIFADPKYDVFLYSRVALTAFFVVITGPQQCHPKTSTDIGIVSSFLCPSQKMGCPCQWRAMTGEWVSYIIIS